MNELFKPIGLASWPRREHYDFFRAYGLPYFSITTEIDITRLRQDLKTRKESFTVGLVYVVARAANAIPEFKQRIREGPVEYRAVHPGLTVLSEGGLFRFCYLKYVEDFCEFATEATEKIDLARRATLLGANPHRDDCLYMSSLPWFSLTGMVHPQPLDPLDSVPRLAWGRFRRRNDRVILPLNVQAHHALIDGRHVARLITQLEELIERSESIL